MTITIEPCAPWEFALDGAWVTGTWCYTVFDDECGIASGPARSPAEAYRWACEAFWLMMG